MSKITTVYDTIRTAMNTLFPNKTEIPNPYSLSDNNDRLLMNGYGIAVGPTSVGELDTFKDHSYVVDFDVIFTSSVITTADNPEPFVTQAKSVLEDSIISRLDMLDFDQLGIYNSIQRIDYAGTTGIEFINSTKFNIIYIANTYSIEISEEI